MGDTDDSESNEIQNAIEYEKKKWIESTYLHGESAKEIIMDSVKNLQEE